MDTFRTWWGKKTYSLKHGETCGMDLMCAPGFHPAVGHVSCDTGTLAEDKPLGEKDTRPPSRAQTYVFKKFFVMSADCWLICLI